MDSKNFLSVAQAVKFEILANFIKSKTAEIPEHEQSRLLGLAHKFVYDIARLDENEILQNFPYMNEDITVMKFGQYLCVPEFASYTNDRIAIRLRDINDLGGAPVAVATVNIPDYDLPDGHVIIKNYSENLGVYPMLKEAGYIEEATTRAQTGFVAGEVCKLTEKSINIINQS